MSARLPMYCPNLTKTLFSCRIWLHATGAMTKSSDSNTLLVLAGLDNSDIEADYSLLVDATYLNWRMFTQTFLVIQ